MSGAGAAFHLAALLQEDLPETRERIRHEVWSLVFGREENEVGEALNRGRPLRCKKNLWTAAARDRVLPCVRPLLRRLTSRGPVWEFVDQVHITEARSKRSPFAWFS